MSQYSVVGDVSETLRDMLWTQMEADMVIKAILSDQTHISFEPPFRLFTEQGAQQNYLSIFLYRVIENPDLKNRPMYADPEPDYRFPPLTLNFFYLVTPLTNSALNDYKLLGKTMQAFYDNAVIQGSNLHGLLRDNAEDIRLSLNSASLEDITKLWCAFLRPYRLSVSYEVRAVIVDSERTTRAERVRRKRLEFEQIGINP